MLYKDETTDELFHSEDSPDCVVLDVALLHALSHTDGDFDRVHWQDGQGYYMDRLMVTMMGEDE